MVDGAIQVLFPTAIPVEDYLVELVGATRTVIYWNTAKLGAQPNQATLDAVTQQQADDARLAVKRDNAAALTTNGAAAGNVTRAIVAVLVDELNALRQWLASFKVEVAAATTLADLKTRVAGLPNMPNRTLAQAKTAILDRIDDGTAD